MRKNGRFLSKILLLIYILAVIWIILFKLARSFDDLSLMMVETNKVINIYPFKESVITNGGLDLSEIINNMLIFIPMGGLLSILYKNKSWFKKTFFIFLFSLALESSQYIFSLGRADITDLITNTLGGIFGILLYEILKKLFNEEKLDNFLIKIAYLIFILTLSIILILLDINK